MLTRVRDLAGAVALSGALLLTLVAPALAAPTAVVDAQNQSGLVNVSGVAVAVPIAVAANACNLNVAALSSALAQGNGRTTCTNDQGQPVTIEDRGSGGRQSGLVNVSGVAVAVPIAVAANICQVNVAALTTLLAQGNGQTTCTNNQGQPVNITRRA